MGSQLLFWIIRCILLIQVFPFGEDLDGAKLLIQLPSCPHHDTCDHDIDNGQRK
jgi:hypothetical protein